MQLRIIILTLVLQVLLVSCATSTSKDTTVQDAPNRAEDSDASRISTIPLRSEKTTRFIIRRSRPHLVTYNVLKTPLRTLGFDNRNDDNGDTVTASTATARSDVLNSTASAVVENQSKVDSKIQAKSDIIDYGSLNEDQFYDQPQQYKPQSLYDYNTMHASAAAQYQPQQHVAPVQQQERGQPQKYADAPKLEYLHAYQFADDVQDGGINGQDQLDEPEYPKHRLTPQLQQLQQLQVQQPQEQVSEIEISKSKQFSYSLRKPEHQSSFHSSFSQQPQAAALQQVQQPQHNAFQPQQPQFTNTYGRETAFLKQTPSTVVPQHQQHEEFKFQRINRPPVEKEVNFDEYTKPVHIHHHYPVQHTEETEQLDAQPPTPHGQAAQFNQPIRSQFYPATTHISQPLPQLKGTLQQPQQQQNSHFQINADPEPTNNPFGHAYNQQPQSYIPARKQPTKQPWLETSYDIPTTRSPPPKWENPHHIDNTKAPVDEERERPQVVYPNNIRIEIPEEEIYKHIQNSVHQIIRDLKEKRTKEQHQRGKPLANQDQSWSKFLMHDPERKEKTARPTYNKTAVTFDSYPTKAVAQKDFYGQESEAPEKPHDQSFHQFHQQQPLNVGQGHQHHHRINSRHHEEEKPFGVSNNKYTTFRFDEGYNSAPATTRVTEATQYENGAAREPVSATVDITMKNPKKAPIIDLNALDVGQTWNHDSHFEAIREHEQKQAYLNSHKSRPASISAPVTTQYHTHHHAAPTNNSFGATMQPSYDLPKMSPPRVHSNFHPDSNGNSMAYVGSAINVKDPFPMRSVTPTPSFFKASQPEPEVPEVDIMHGMLPVVNQFDNGHQVMKVILDPSKMPRELVTDASPSTFPQDLNGQFPTNVQTIQYNMNHQHLAVPIVHTQQPNNQVFLKAQQPQQQQQQQSFPNHLPEQQQNFLSFAKERKSKGHTSGAWANNIPEASANVIQYLPPPPLPASRSLLPYDSYSPIYNEDLSLGKTISSSILRNKRHRGSEEYKKIIRTTYPRNSKKIKTVKIMEPSTEMKPPPKFNKFSKKSSTI